MPIRNKIHVIKKNADEMKEYTYTHETDKQTTTTFTVSAGVRVGALAAPVSAGAASGPWASRTSG